MCVAALRHELALPILTPRVRVRRLAAADLPAFVAYRADPDVGRFQGWTPMSVEASRGFIEEMSTAPGLVGGRWWQLAIADASTDALLGDIGLHPDAQFGELELGFTLAASHQGRGLAREALAALLGALFRETNLQGVRGVTDARNGPSIVLLERLGFRRAAEQRTRFRGEPCMEYVYVLDRPRAPDR